MLKRMDFFFDKNFGFRKLRPKKNQEELPVATVVGIWNSWAKMTPSQTVNTTKNMNSARWIINKKIPAALPLKSRI